MRRAEQLAANWLGADKPRAHRRRVGHPVEADEFPPTAAAAEVRVNRLRP
jgi:hypothetical protein